MSRVNYRGSWCPAGYFFQLMFDSYGVICHRHNHPCGATWAYGVLGPDLRMPGSVAQNPPRAGGAPWDKAFSQGIPTVRFDQDTTFNRWYRGHLINGEWGGTGTEWKNLVPLTSVANSNHTTIEDHIRDFLDRSLRYEHENRPPDWYCVLYLVERSQDPFSTVDTADDLYSYAPAFIKVSWRAVTYPKPTNIQRANTRPELVHEYFRNHQYTQVTQFPFTLSAPIGHPTLPINNTPGTSLVHSPTQFAFPAAQSNGFDEEIEIHQT